MELLKYLLHPFHRSVEHDGHSHWNMYERLKEWYMTLVNFCG